MTNQTITAILKWKVCGNMGVRADLILEVLWAYNTTARTSTGHPPFTLTFRIDVVAPIEIRLGSAQVENYNEESNGSLLDKENEERERRSVNGPAY